jgi:hypothetical protein
MIGILKEVEAGMNPIKYWPPADRANRIKGFMFGLKKISSQAPLIVH